jgi:tRNA U34 5-carboxymethylaminomethyl modifying GTPase MnmE/TrmE
MQRIDDLLSHVWMVRTFLKHSDEVQEDEELNDIYRTLYDYMHALGEPAKLGDADGYLRQAQKKFAKLRAASERFGELQPEISTHTNFQMAARSLRTAVEGVGAILQGMAQDEARKTEA